MLSMMMTLMGKAAPKQTSNDTTLKPRVTQQEMATLFAKDLARPALQKRAKVRVKNPRLFMAGRQLQFA